MNKKKDKMRTHLNTFETQVEYQQKEALLDAPHVDLIEETNSVSYKEVEIPEKEVSYNLYDILWSDGTATQEIRPTSDGVTPVGLCVIPTGWLDEGEKARFVSLKYMSSSTPASGGLAVETMYWGTGFTNKWQDPLIDNYVGWLCRDEVDGKLGDTVYGYCNLKVPEASNFKDLRVEDNWKYTLEYCKQNPNRYAIGDIDGKQNTANASVDGMYYEEGAADMKRQVAQYAPKGTKAGDWYVPAAGELLQFTFKLKSDTNSPAINDKVAEIAKVYPQDCVTKFVDNNAYWTSTVANELQGWSSYVNGDNVGLSCYNRVGKYRVVAYLKK